MTQEYSESIKESMRKKTTSQLRDIWLSNNQIDWTPKAILTAKEILEERGEKIPEQSDPVLEISPIKTTKKEAKDIIYVSILSMFFWGTVNLLTLLPYWDQMSSLKAEVSFLLIATTFVSIMMLGGAVFHFKVKDKKAVLYESSMLSMIGLLNILAAFLLLREKYLDDHMILGFLQLAWAVMRYDKYRQINNVIDD